ncbi:MAG: SIMPL domain-containing protein [Pseudomonadota bacterium]
MMRFALPLVVILPCAAMADDHLPEIVVAATGTVSAAPDMATVTVGVSHEAPTAAEAMAALAATSAAVLEEVKSLGIEERDVQTSSLNLNPVWDQGNTRTPSVRGYTASGMLSVRVRDLDSLGALLDDVTNEGANRLNGLIFGISDRDPLEDQARRDAVLRAKAKAETLAAAAGVRLGPVQRITEGTQSATPTPMMRGAMMEAASMPIASGELEVRVSVTVTFAIAE